jgi:hypothetical protein
MALIFRCCFVQSILERTKVRPVGVQCNSLQHANLLVLPKNRGAIHCNRLTPMPTRRSMTLFGSLLRFRFDRIVVMSFCNARRKQSKKFLCKLHPPHDTYHLPPTSHRNVCDGIGVGGRKAISRLTSSHTMTERMCAPRPDLVSQFQTRWFVDTLRDLGIDR